MADVKTIGVVGAGQLGTGIARVCVTSGFTVIVRDIADEIVRRCYQEIEGGLGREVERGRMTAEAKAETMNRFTATTDVSQLKRADFVIEAVNENIALKQRVFAELDQTCPPHTILATNSTGIPVTTIASVTKRPDRCAKLHFWHPPFMLPYTEISRGYLTSDETWQTVKDVAKATKRNPIMVVMDYEGSSNSYLNQVPKAKEYSNHWAWDLMLGTKTPQDIEAISTTMGARGGGLNPMAFSDFTGLDIGFNSNEYMFQAYRHPSFVTPPLIRRMVEAGHLGIKAGIGFYDYRQTGRRAEKLSPYLLKFLQREEPQAEPGGG